MPSVSRTTLLAAPAAEVWAAVGDFAGIADWHPGTTEPTLRDPAVPDGPADAGRPGVERVFAAGTADQFVERLVARDDAGRRLVYTIPDPPFPIADHEATLALHERGPDRTEVVWTATFDATPETAAALQTGLGDDVFGVGLDALVDRFGRG